jgi:hypothetical protein
MVICKDMRKTDVSDVLSLRLPEIRKTSNNRVHVENKYVCRDES